MFSFRPPPPEDLRGNVAFSSLREVYISKLNVISYWHVSSWLAFFFLSWLTFPLQTGNSIQFPLWFCAILAPLKKYRFTGRRTHLSVSRHCTQNTIFPPMKTRKLEYHSLSYMFPRSDLLHISICSGRGFFQKNYFNTVQLMYHIWTTNPASLAYWNFFHNIKTQVLTSISWHNKDALWWGKEP